jgi:hypothetical protein
LPERLLASSPSEVPVTDGFGDSQDLGALGASLALSGRRWYGENRPCGNSLDSVEIFIINISPVAKRIRKARPAIFGP